MLQEIRLAEESSRQTATPMSSQEKAELAHSLTQMLLQLARWMAHTGQGAKADVTGRSCNLLHCPLKRPVKVTYQRWSCGLRLKVMAMIGLQNCSSQAGQNKRSIRLYIVFDSELLCCSLIQSSSLAGAEITEGVLPLRQVPGPADAGRSEAAGSPQLCCLQRHGPHRWQSQASTSLLKVLDEAKLRRSRKFENSRAAWG